MIYRISRPLFNAVISAQSVDDVREYLNGFYVNTHIHELVATNGHFLCRAPLEIVEDEGDSDEPVIFSGIEKPIPKSVDSVLISTSHNIARLEGPKYKHKRDVGLTRINENYPAYKMVIPTSMPDPAKEFALNTEYLYRPFKWVGIDFPAADIRIYNNDKKLVVKSRDASLKDLEMILMMCI